VANSFVITPETPRVLRPFASIEVGDCCVEHASITQSMVETFIDLAGDVAPVHVDDAHAQAMGLPKVSIYGFLTILRFSRLFGMFLPGGWSVCHTVQFEYLRPLFLSDEGRSEVTYAARVTRCIEPLKAVLLAVEVTQGETVMAKGSARCVMLR
jgi:acyl dehydratase